MFCFKYLISILLSILSFHCFAYDINGCFWEDNPQSSEVRRYASSPLTDVNIFPLGNGSTLSQQTVIVLPKVQRYLCPAEITYMSTRWSIDGTELVAGYDNVYQTGLKGIGIKLRWGLYPIPRYTGNFNNPGYNVPMYQTMLVTLVQTDSNIEYGQLDIDFTVSIKIMDVEVAVLKIQSKSKVTGDLIFSGCSGRKNNTIQMGRVSLEQFANVPVKQFELDVICKGLPAGSNPPVNIYFEGDSPGAGRLALTPGGAKGVELQLQHSNTRQPLPFNKNAALRMLWINSQPDGEVYRLPISAEYAVIHGQKIVAGKADATLNYIISYK